MKVKILALSGSLRAASINSALLRAAVRLAPPDIAVAVYPGLGALPLFDPDHDANAPRQVMLLRGAVADADALLIASPEYAHGVTGTIKNALDWLVSFEQFMNKPVAIINTSPRAHHADDALRETLKTMSADIIEAASVSIPLLGANLDDAGMAASPEVSRSIRGALNEIQRAVMQRVGTWAEFLVALSNAAGR